MEARVGSMTNVGDVIFDWSRTKPNDRESGYRVVTRVIRCEDLGRFTDGVWWKGSSAERCALHGGHPRRENGQ
jgi:hypothetical protein